ncbi:MAG: leucine-rich repeat protein, partial [Muribaculaceae bacterium]
SIGDHAFYGCSGLTSVSIPNSVTSIGESAFCYCSSLASITIGKSVTSIGGGAFFNCSGLTSIIVDSENQIYDSRENCNAIIETASNKLLYGSNNTIIPNSVASIGGSAFYGCSGLTSVSIPNSVASIGGSAFYGCSGLTSVSIPNSVNSIGTYAFHGCSGLTSITIGNSVTSIGDWAFSYCSGLTSVISKAVTPPACGDEVFSTSPTYRTPLIVPSIAKEAYKAASTWSNFSNYAEPESKITNASFNYNESYVVIGNPLQLNVKVTPVDATFADVLQWSSSNPDVATVDNNGLVTAITKGDAEIIATTCDGSNLSTSCIIKVLESNDEVLAALNALVAKAETLYKNSVEGDRIGDYTPGARAELFASIESVKSKISESMSADEITACTNEINAAIQLFESKKVTNGEDTDVSLHENIIFVENAEAFVGKSVTLSLKMNNTIVPVGFQCDFYAPSKTSVPTDEDGFYAIDLSTERTTASRHNIFESGLQKDGGIRILAASTRNYPFAGNEGEVITITLNVDADLEEGEYPLILRNVIISDAQSNTYSVDYVKSTLTVSDYTPGDVNGDGSINIGDVTAVVSHIMGAETNVFIEKAADVTGDGSVNIGDLTGIVGMIIGGNSLAPATKATTKAIASPKTSDISGYDNVIYAKDVTFGEDGRATLSINMKNSVVTPGFQFDIVMPEGIEIEKDEIGYIIELSTERTTTRKTNIFESGLQKDGSVRVLAASTKNTPFEGNDGEVCTVSLILGEGTAPGEYEVVLKNIIISDPKGVTYSVDKTTAIITVPGSINEAANVNELVSGANNVGFGLQGVKMHNGVLYACTTAESVNKSTPTLHGNNAVNMDTYEDRNFADFDQRDWVAISGLVDGFVGKELSYPFVATFAEGVLTPSETINAKADATPYTLNTFRAENILHGGYSNYAERDYKAYYVPARVNEVAKFM